MESIVKDLLEELYIIEPNLRKQEKHLSRIVTLMVKNIPKSEMDIAFKKVLKTQILSRIHSKKNKYYTLYLPILSGLSLCGVLLFVGINISSSILTPEKMISFAPSIEQVEPNAFGNSIKTTWGQQMEYMPKSWSQMMRVWKMMGDTQMLAVNTPVQYEYSYTGKLDIPSGKLIVYKRNSVWFAAADTSGFIRHLRLDGLDTRAFQNAGISNINISEDHEFGYNIGIDFTQGTVNFNQNYLKWPQATCDTNGCIELAKLTEKDIPSDESLIRMTDEFISKYSIDRELYGNPVVNSEWRTDYMKQQKEESELYIPETFTVTYPIKINNQYIYEEFGGYKWLVLTIDIRNHTVSSVTGLEKYNLVASEYPTSDKSKIQKMIQSGGRNIIEITGSTIVTKITLLAPTLWYVRIYGEWKDGVSNDFLVPAYIFQVHDKPADSYILDTVIVPLVEWFSESISLPTRPPMEPVMMQ